MTFNEAMMNKNLTMVFGGTTPIGSTKFRDVNGNEVIVDMADTKEDKDMTKAQIREALKEAGVELSNTQFKKMLKAE